MTELTVITDRDLKIAYIKTVVVRKALSAQDDDYFDKVIAAINWKNVNQCAGCHAYFDEGDRPDDDKFCSDECKYEIELGEKRVRGHNLFNV